MHNSIPGGWFRIVHPYLGRWFILIYCIYWGLMNTMVVSQCLNTYENSPQISANRSLFARGRTCQLIFAKMIWHGDVMPVAQLTFMAILAAYMLCAYIHYLHILIHMHVISHWYLAVWCVYGCTVNFSMQYAYCNSWEYACRSEHLTRWFQDGVQHVDTPGQPKDEADICWWRCGEWDSYLLAKL